MTTFLSIIFFCNWQEMNAIFAEYFKFIVGMIFDFLLLQVIRIESSKIILFSIFSLVASLYCSVLRNRRMFDARVSVGHNNSYTGSE